MAFRRLINTQSTEFDIDREVVARIVGAGGVSINRIRDQLGVKIDFSDEHEDKDKTGKKKPTLKTHVKIVGRKEKAEDAKKRIQAQAERIADEVFETIKIPNQYHSALIGQGGKYAIRLEEKYGVKITFPRQGENGEGRTRETLKPDEVLIKGGKKGVSQTKAELLEASILFTSPRHRMLNSPIGP
jgi:predicted PilT family ATPase